MYILRNIYMVIYRSFSTRPQKPVTYRGLYPGGSEERPYDYIPAVCFIAYHIVL